MILFPFKSNNTSACRIVCAVESMELLKLCVLEMANMFIIGIKRNTRFEYRIHFILISATSFEDAELSKCKANYAIYENA